MKVSSGPPGLLQQNRYQLKLIVEGLKAKELKATSDAERAEIASMRATWEAMYRAAGGDPDKVRPASALNDFKHALAPMFPMLDPERYSQYEQDLVQIREYQTAAQALPGDDKNVLKRREAALEASLGVKKNLDRMQAVGMGLAQLSWMSALPAYLALGTPGLLVSAGMLVGGVATLIASQQLHDRPALKMLEMTPPGDVMTIARWLEKGDELVEEHIRKQAELVNSAHMMLNPEKSGIATQGGHLLVGGVRLKLKGGSAPLPPPGTPVHGVPPPELG